VIADTPYIAVYRIKERIEILLIRHAAQGRPE
jgi:plasmid stabilization system protein ParE